MNYLHKQRFQLLVTTVGIIFASLTIIAVVVHSILVM